MDEKPYRAPDGSDDEWEWLPRGSTAPAPIMPEILERLVTLILTESLKAQSREIQIDCGDASCPIYFLRDSEKLARDKLPKRVFGPLANHVARLCRKAKSEGSGTFSIVLPKPGREVSVSVDFESAMLRMTIGPFANP